MHCFSEEPSKAGQLLWLCATTLIQEMAQEEDEDRGTEKTHLEGGGKPASSSRKSSEPFFVLLDLRSGDPVLPLPSRECKSCENAWEPVGEQGLGMMGLVLCSFPPQPFPPLLSPLSFSLCCICLSSWKPECSLLALPTPGSGYACWVYQDSSPQEPQQSPAAWMLPGAHSLLRTRPGPIL